MARNRGNSAPEDGASHARSVCAIAFLNACILSSILRTLEYLHVPVFQWIGGLERMARLFR